MNTVTMYLGDVRDVLERLAAEGATFDLAITSPPFYKLRSYLPGDHAEKHRELGSEASPAEFLDNLYALTAQLDRLLPEWASICVELGDTMAGSGGAGGDYNLGGLREGQEKFNGTAYTAREDTKLPKVPRGDMPGGGITNLHGKVQPGGDGHPLPKSMCLVPHAYTIGLAYGHNPLTGQPTPAGQWRIRNVITWARPNPPVGSLGKRNPERRTGDYKFRPACSFITVACRGTGRYFDLDAVRTDGSPNTHARLANGVESRPTNGKKAANPNNNFGSMHEVETAGAPPLDWHTDDLDGDWLWKLATAPYKGAHYATFPLTLPRRLILAMAPQRVCTVCGWPSERIAETANSVGHAVGRTAWTRDSATAALMHSGPITMDANHASVPDIAERVTLGWTDCAHDAWRPGRVIDIFGGSGTTAVAAALEGRDAVLIDLDARNVDLVRRRLNDELRIVNERRDGDSIVWTVETRAPHQADQCDGQSTLLDLLDGGAA